jgi:EAL domain-containing protein (putative c-di-GMP-specific phosphodiesterase class I)/AmiR/NasT family two-component response regulator
VPDHESGARVLIVDDVEANVALLTAILRRAGFGEVHGLSDSREVVAWCADLDPDIVLLDLHMPHMDGLAVIEALQPLRAPEVFLPIVVLTADVNRAAREAALAAGASDFLTKPFDHTEVVLRIRNLLHTRALYLELRRHNAALEQQLEAQRIRDARAATRRQAKSTRISDVLRHDQMSMVFQAIFELVSGAIAGYEALARFSHPLRRSPERWFAEAAEVGLGAELELAAVRKALAELGSLAPGAVLTVNVSPATAGEAELVELVAAAQQQRPIVVELTEHTRVDDYRTMSRHLNRLRSRGALIAIDDAGTGYAGLQHILRLQPDVVKLDRDLISRIDSDPARLALSSSLSKFASDIGAVLVAEGIETRAELDVLRGLGIPWGQGYFLARPGPADQQHGSVIQTARTT